MTVGRANTVLTTKTKRTEAVKAALRVAMAKPTRLYDTCGSSGDVALGGRRARRRREGGLPTDHPPTPLSMTPRSGSASRPCRSARPFLPSCSRPALLTHPRPPMRHPSGPENAWQADATSDVSDGQAVVAEPPGARSVDSHGARRVADASAFHLHGVLPRHVPRCGHHRRSDILHVGHLLLRERRHHHQRGRRRRRFGKRARAARTTRMRPSRPSPHHRSTTSMATVGRSCSARPDVWWSTTQGRFRSGCGSTTATSSPATSAPRRRPACRSSR